MDYCRSGRIIFSFQHPDDKQPTLGGHKFKICNQYRADFQLCIGLLKKYLFKSSFIKMQMPLRDLLDRFVQKKLKTFYLRTYAISEIIVTCSCIKINIFYGGWGRESFSEYKWGFLQKREKNNG